MYRTFVISALIRDLVLVLIPLLGGAFVFFGARLYREKNWGRALLLLCVTFGGMSVLEGWNESRYIRDYLLYLQQGDRYVQEAACRLDDVMAGTASGILSAMESLYCEDGSRFVTKYRRDYQRVLWRWAKERRVLRVRYLPGSRLALELVPVPGP